MGLWSSIVGAVSSAGRAVARVATAAWEGAKRVAGAVVGWVADKGEALIGGVKAAWGHVRPHVEKIRAFLLVASATAPFPWLAATAQFIAGAISALTAFERSPVARAVESALRWLIRMAQRMRQTSAVADVVDIDAREVDETERHLLALEQAAHEANASQRAAFDAVAMIGHLVVAVGHMKMQLDAVRVDDLDRYLQVSAMQQLLSGLQLKLAHATDAAAFDADDRFVLRVAAMLAKGTTGLDVAEATELDRIVRHRHRKSLVGLVFDGMLGPWQERLTEAQAATKLQTANMTQLKGELRSLRISRRLQVEGKLSDELEARLTGLEQEVSQADALWNAAVAHERDTAVLYFSAKGFMAIFQMSPEELNERGFDEIAEQSRLAGLLVLRLLQERMPLSSLETEERALVEDMANVFVSLLTKV